MPASMVCQSTPTPTPMSRRSGRRAGLHPDFGAGSTIGIPFITIDGGVPPVDIAFDIADESDPGPYPIPPAAPIEEGPCSDGDRHVLVVDAGACTLYELFDAHPQADGSWTAGSGAMFDLHSNSAAPLRLHLGRCGRLADRAGAGSFRRGRRRGDRHALRFTSPRTQDAFVWPARHAASEATIRICRRSGSASD